ncbi:Z1 domain-containing protein [Lacibacter sp. H375]|uniref:Z1 domain-containing protein n=1 Tax=Lacibacter sp. H375 TaxID=3133424 RepID=UPI0030BCC89A
MNVQALKICVTLLEGVLYPTDQDVVEVISKVSSLFSLNEAEKENLRKHLISVFGIFSEGYKILDGKEGYSPWIKAARGQINLSFWKRYEAFMQHKMARDTLNKLDNLTDDILDRIGNPAVSGNWDKRGLVVGQVQSGKTGNYIGLINKAADTGYKLIIVLAGMHDSLRSQTQIRIDEGFLGYNTQRSLQYSSHYFLGVSKFNPTDPITGNIKELPVHALTSGHINGDFNQTKIQGSTNLRGSDPIVAVVKKNSSILKNLILWLAKWGTKNADGKLLIQNLPILIIDDEADNASINVSKERVSAINGYIRALLSLFEQSAYVGYTATPFANVFIPLKDAQNSKGLDVSIKDFAFSVGDDLFPKDFIINIPAPSNYIGPCQLFGLEDGLVNQEIDPRPLPLIRNVIDFDDADTVFVPDKHKKHSPLPKALPDSLKRAIKCFLLAVTARRTRGQINTHNSMLVHVSRFIRWQDHISVLVDEELKFYQRQVDQRTGSLLSELRELWISEFEPTSQTILAISNTYQDPSITQISWSEIEANLHAAIMPIEVRAVHGDKNIAGLHYHNISPLDYFVAEQTGTYLNIIAVGGDKLSRGLTLEGLSISYYLRASKMYDTLMQMGRWFGYRPGYSDLCRVFTTGELIRWYRHITIASEEMRAEFDYMYHLRRTPKEYGLKVRTHPGVLKITAANKFRYHTTMLLSYSGSLAQTYEFDISEKKVKNNIDITSNLIKSLGKTSPILNKENRSQLFFWRGLNNFRVITTFLRNYLINPTVMDVRKICDYIEAQASKENLTNWNILLVNNSTAAADRKYVFPGLSESVGLTDRTNQSDKEGIYQVSKANITDQRHEMVDFDDEQISSALSATITDFEFDLQSKSEEEKTKAKQPTQPSRPRIRQQRKSREGLLIIYPMNPDPYHIDLETEKKGVRKTIASLPIIGIALSFPELVHDEKIEYAVNEQFQNEYDYPEEFDQNNEDESTDS